LPVRAVEVRADVERDDKVRADVLIRHSELAPEIGGEFGQGAMIGNLG
jgi:hypothetical protein